MRLLTGCFFLFFLFIWLPIRATSIFICYAHTTIYNIYTWFVQMFNRSYNKNKNEDVFFSWTHKKHTLDLRNKFGHILKNNGASYREETGCRMCNLFVSFARKFFVVVFLYLIISIRFYKWTNVTLVTLVFVILFK